MTYDPKKEIYVKIKIIKYDFREYKYTLKGREIC